MVGFTDLLNLFISNIEKADVDVIKNITDLLPNTQVSYYADLFNFIVDYYEKHKQVPSSEFLEKSYPGIWLKTSEPISKEALNILLYELNQDATINKTLLALQNRDTEKAKSILDNSNPKAEFSETKVEDVCSSYDSMNQLPEGLQIGVRELDNIYKNFSYGTNNFIAAPQKSGKTTSAISIAYDGLILRGMNVVYITLEVKPFDIFANFFARHAHEMGTSLNAQKIKKNMLDENERELMGEVQKNFIECMEKMGGHLSVIANHDLPDFTISYLKQFLEQKAEEWGRVDLVVIDHIGLTGYYPMKGVPDKKDRINAWIKATTDLAKEFNNGLGFILISLLQINRQGTLLMKKGKSIGFDVLAEANEAERSCHTCTVMYSTPELLLANTVRLYCLANRNGPPLSTDKEDNSIETYLNPSAYILGHRKYGNAINLSNKDLLKSDKSESSSFGSDLFSSMV